MEKIKSIFVSDLHLGVRHNKVSELLDILDRYEFENLFLVGDIIDMTALKRKAYWKKSYGKLFKKLIQLSEKVNIIYITGNHDYYLREFTPFNIGSIKFVDEYIYHDTLIIHGDKFDTLIYNKRWLYFLGAFGYGVIIFLDRILNFNGVLSKNAKKQVKRASNYLNDFYNTAAKYTEKSGCFRLVCGHTHIQEEKNLPLITYYNCGDFRESSTYIIENLKGKFELR